MKWTRDGGREVEVEERERPEALTARTVVLQNPPPATVLFLHDPDTRS